MEIAVEGAMKFNGKYYHIEFSMVCLTPWKIPWASLYGMPWSTVDIHGTPRVVPWITMEFQRVPVEFHGVP